MTEENKRILHDALATKMDEAYLRGKQESAELVAELVEALNLMIEMAQSGMVDFNPHDEYVMAKARAAIAKATGE